MDTSTKTQTQFTPRILAESSAKHHITAPTEDIDITDCLFNVEELEYINCTPHSKAHLSAGFTHSPEGKRMSINVEDVAGALMIEHYVEDIGEKLHCRLLSTTDSLIDREYTTAHVIWELIAVPGDNNYSNFVNNVWVHTTEHYDRFLAKHGIGDKQSRKNFQNAVDLHNAEETPCFAEAIERKALKGEL
jgi:hypothetical protein